MSKYRQAAKVDANERRISYSKLQFLISHLINSGCGESTERITGLLWSIDMKSYQETGESITGARYIKVSWGFYPIGFWMCLNSLIDEKRARN